MLKDEDTTEEITLAHEIMHQFQYNYQEQWVPQKVLFGTSRRYVKVFNDLVKQGLILRRKSFSGYQYKWVGRFP
jgi:hypothetical protein